MSKISKAISIFLAIAVLVTCLCICVVFQENQHINTIKFVFRTDDNILERVSLIYKEGKYWAFLPSYVDFASMKIEYNTGCRLYIDDVFYENESACSTLTEDKSHIIKIKNSIGGTSENVLIIKKTSPIATMSLHLADGSLEQINADKNVSKSGMMLLVDDTSQTNYYGNFMKLQGRGNSTWSQAKKSYSLEFNEAVDLLGMGLGKKWILLGNQLDESGLRNKLVYDAAKQFGVNYAIDSEYVDLYVDNQYIGLYLLTEKVEVAVNRVEIPDLLLNTQNANSLPLSNYPQIEKTIGHKIQRSYDIPKNPEDISGGYLLEIEYYDDRINEIPSLIQTDSLNFSIKSPRYPSKEQIEYIYNYCNKIETEIKNGNLSGLNIDSFAIYYLMQELFANADASSFFFYKDSDKVDAKLYAGPIWDFDLSLRNSFSSSEYDPTKLARNNDNWFNYLTQNKEFQKAVKDKYWLSFRPVLEEFIEKSLTEYCARIDKSFQINKIRWENEHSYNDWADTCQKHFDTIEEHKASIVSFMKERLQFFDSLWGTTDKYYIVSFYSEEIGTFYKNYYAKEGSALNLTPNPSSAKTDEHTFSGWYDKNGDLYSPEKVITHNEQYYAKWEKAINTDSIIDKLGINNILKETLILILLAFIIIVFIVIDTLQNPRRCKKNDE